MSRRFCPECGSEDVGPDFRKSNVLGEAVFNNDKWNCSECGYTGLMPEGEASEDMEFEKNTHQFEENRSQFDELDVSAGKAYFEYWFYIFLPAVVLFMLSLILL